ncbi:MAG: hypothetical protein IJ960_00385 [Oscillospiraceae bacterium]|nr:hypothetical protein [Oscillospiraceae bacterium]
MRIAFAGNPNSGKTTILIDAQSTKATLPRERRFCSHSILQMRYMAADAIAHQRSYPYSRQLCSSAGKTRFGQNGRQTKSSPKKGVICLFQDCILL